MKKITLLFLLFSISLTGFCTTWTINNSANTFTPSTITINVGDSVKFVTTSSHDAREVSQITWNANGNTALSAGFQTAFGGGVVLPSQLGVGTHYYVCTPHASLGMKGTIIVQNCNSPATPGTISGNTNVCGASSNIYSIPAVTGATSYTWTLPGGWIGTSTTNSLSAVASTTGGNITVTANNSCGSSIAQTLAVTTNTAPSSPATINGNETICATSSNTYSISAVTGATSYTWTLPGGWTGTSTTNSITSTSSTTSGNITVTANNACGSSSNQTLVVTVIASIPAAPGSINGDTNVCGASSNIYSIMAVSGATSYTWTLPSGWIGTSTTNSITSVASSTSGNITVTAKNACGSSTNQTLVVTVNASIPAAPGTINGDTNVCGASSNIYSIAAVTGATSYTWTLPVGWTGISTTNSLSAVASTTGGNITVTANNACGSSIAQTLTVNMNTAPTLPAAISGNETICATSSNTYSITAVTDATSYTWTLPGGWTGTSTTNSITSTSSTTSGNITVTANNACGSSSNQTLVVNVNASIPAAPGTINGDTTVCGASSNIYSITAVSGATSYTWTLPGGWTGTSTTNSLSAVASTTGGNITVTANNACGSSATQTVIVTVSGGSALSQPGPISGNASVCPASSNTYSITAVSGATSYTWTLPSGWIGTSTTNSITSVASSTSGNITISANNSCGSSAAQTLSLTVNSVDTSVSQSGAILTAGASGAVYQWINCIDNTPISGQTNQSFTASTNGNYAVIVLQNTCSNTSSCYNIFSVGIIENNSSMIIIIYPNPSNGKFIIEMKQMENGVIEIYNALGEKVYQSILLSTHNVTTIDLSMQPKGIYFANIYDGEKINSKKIIVQ